MWSRFWPSALVGRRSFVNTRVVLRDVRNRMDSSNVPLIVTDGFEYYARVVRQVFGPMCLFGQVVKTRRNDRIIKVERCEVIGEPWKFERALGESEDSHQLNTSFIERLNLTIRQGCAYLTRRSTCHARSEKQLENQIEILRCHYNFMRPHRALKFGTATRTPAMQAGLVRRRLSFRDVFTSPLVSASSKGIVYLLGRVGSYRDKAA